MGFTTRSSITSTTAPQTTSASFSSSFSSNNKNNTDENNNINLSAVYSGTSYKTPEYYWQTRNWIIKFYEERVNKQFHEIKTGLTLAGLKQLKLENDKNDDQKKGKKEKEGDNNFNFHRNLAPVAGGNSNNVYLEGSNQDRNGFSLSDGT